MRIYVPGDDAVPPQHLLGGKATGLMRLREAGGAWRVPSFVVLLPDEDDRGIPPADELQAALARVGIRANARLAVRSSAAVEDGSTQSFAGQFESVLGVRADDREALANAIERVRSSASSDRVHAYHGPDRGLTPNSASTVDMAVVVQELVDAEASGVAFSVDPVAPSSGLGVVSAVPGLGEGLVSGALDADTWWVSVNGSRARTVRRQIVRKPDAIRLTERGTAAVPLPDSTAGQPTLTDEEVSMVGAVTADVAARAGAPMDVEWALGSPDAQGRRTLFLLQARPITTLHQASRGQRRLWDNSNIAESYSGVTTPLTFTFARSVYEDAYRQFFRIMGVSPERIEQQRHVFANMLGLVRGRVYYNLLNWYQVLSLLPGFRFNRSFMERMMGVREPLADSIEAGSTGGRFGDAMHLVRTLAGMALEARRLPSEVPAFHARVDRALGPLTPEHVAGLTADDAVALYRKLEGELLRHWRAPLVNDFFAMIYFGVLGRLTARWLRQAPPTLVNDLLVGDGDIVSTQPARSVMQIARLVRDTPAAGAHFQLSDDRAVWQRLVDDPECAVVLERFGEHLRRFGDRTMEELKLETITLGEDPALLVGMVRAYLATSAVDDVAAFERERRIRSDAIAVVDRELRGFRRLLYGYVLSRTRVRVRDRENLRFERTRVFGVVRRIFLAIGKELAGRGHLAGQRDVFYLTLEEVFAHFGGTGVTRDLRALASRRKEEFAAFAAEPAPPDRIETFGPLADWRSSDLPTVVTQGGELRGTGCCPGAVRGIVRVVTDPRGARDLAGHILVAERTDPGWTLLFPVCSGLLVQRGSLLSHSAIVAREMGLPCIVGLTGLMSWLKDGDRVEMDGTTGLVRRLEPADAA